MGEHEIGKAMLGELNSQLASLEDGGAGFAVAAGPIRGR